MSMLLLGLSKFVGVVGNEWLLLLMIRWMVFLVVLIMLRVLVRGVGVSSFILFGLVMLLL